jgi:hypothetical protein
MRRAASPIQSLARAEGSGPEPLVPILVRGAQPDVAERGDARVPGERTALSRRRPPHQLDPVAGGVGEREHRRDVALVALGPRALAERVPPALQQRGGLRQAVRRHRGRDLEHERLPAQVATDVDEVVIGPVTRAQVGALVVAAHQLEPQDLGGEAHARVQVRAAEPHRPDVVQPPHRH